MGYMDMAYKKYNELTNNYFKEKSIEEIKEFSQYFTSNEIADALFKDVIIIKKDVIKILDTSCGNGILILKLINIIVDNYIPKEIVIYTFDIDKILIENINIILKCIDLKSKGINICTKLYCTDFLKSNINMEFDYIIMNPPYKKINASDVPFDLKGIIIGQPNLYHLFIAKALELLNKDGVLCVLSPKNYLSGKYTEKLRNRIINHYSLYKIHTFNNRTTFFDIRITQEICIVHISRKHFDEVRMSYNGNDAMVLPAEKLIIDDRTNIIYTPRNMDDYILIDKFKKFPRGVIGNNIYMKTGKVVQFRVKDEFLSEEEYQSIKNGVPLIVYRHINFGKLIYNKLISKNRNKAITIYDNTKTQSLLINNKNYVILRKNTDKKYEKLISCIAYLKDLETDKLGIDNGLAYLTNVDDSLTELEVRGIQCVLMSKQFDDYYRLVNSSHTLNVYEFENIHFPDMNTIRMMGVDVGVENITIELATSIMDKYL